MEKYQDVKGAFGDGTQVTDVIAFAADTTARRVQLPSAFIGQFVRIRPVGANLQYFFSSSATATIVAAVPSATGQQAATLGEPVPSGGLAEVTVPAIGNNGPIYFCWVCDAAGTGVFVIKGSGVPGLTIGDR